jgi:hypothetical protein
MILKEEHSITALTSVPAGGKAHIGLIITPTAAPGTEVHGIVCVDDAGAQQGVSDESELIGLPYAYTVG